MKLPKIVLLCTFLTSNSNTSVISVAQPITGLVNTIKVNIIARFRAILQSDGEDWKILSNY